MPRSKVISPKSRVKLTVRKAKPSFPRTIAGRTAGEKGLQTSLSVAQGKRLHPKLIVK